MNNTYLESYRKSSQNIKSLPESWARFLDKPEWNWQWYGHLTFRDIINKYDGKADHVHPESAVKTFDKWIHLLNRAAFGVRYWNRTGDGVVWARATELQNRGAIHFHCLIGCIDKPDRAEIRRLDFMDLWWSMAGMARIYQYKPSHGAEFYLSKSCYAWKKGEIDLGGPLVERMTGNFRMDLQQDLFRGLDRRAKAAVAQS